MKEIKAHPSLLWLRTASLLLNCGESLSCFMTYFVIHTSLCICWSYRVVRRLIETRKIVRKLIFWVLGNSNFCELNIWSVCILFLCIKFITNLVFKTNTICTSVLLLPLLFAGSVFQSLWLIWLVVREYCHQVAVDNLIMGFKFPGILKLKQSSG